MHKLPAPPTRRENRPIAQDGDYLSDALFAVGDHRRDGGVLSTEPDPSPNVNTDTEMKMALIGQQRTAHVTNSESMSDRSRIDDRLGLLN